MNKIIDLVKQSKEKLNAQKEALTWNGTIEDYIELVINNPQIAATAHKRIDNMLQEAGIEWLDREDGNGKRPHYKFFENELYGIEECIDKVGEYFNSAGQRLPVRKRLLMLMGPPGSGKSTMVALLKKGLEEYTRSDLGAIYRIKGCPMNDDPLTLLPNDLRKVLKEEYDIHVEGTPCPVCTHVLEHEYDGDWSKFQVERFTFSEQLRRGIGTFMPSDPKCVSLDTLIPTANGLMYLRELNENREQDTFASISEEIINKDGEAEIASHFYYNGRHDTVNIRTKLGFELSATEVHPIRTLVDGKPSWKKASEIHPGDKVQVRYGYEQYGSDTSISEDLARLAGYWVAEGSYYNQVEISNRLDPVIQDMRNIVNKEWGYELPIRKGTGVEEIWSAIICTQDNIEWFKENVFDGNETFHAAMKFVPRKIRQAPKNIQLQFLKGLYAGDGCFRKRSDGSGYVVKYGTASRRLANELQMMLLNMGYLSGVSSYIHAYNDSTQYEVVLYGDQALRFYEEITMFEDKYVDEFTGKPTGRSNFDLIEGIRDDINILVWNLPSNLRGKYTRYGATCSPEYQRSFTRKSAREFSDVVRSNVYITEEVDTALASLEEAITSNSVWLEVTSVECEENEVADLTVPGSHSFVTNGIVSHNTQDVAELVGSINLSKIADYGDEADPRAYDFNGELNVSNRGLVEMIEMLKADEKFLYVLLTLTQEQNIKTPRFPLLFADEIVIAHTNETEWQKFMGKSENEALRDRIITIITPYNLVLSNEVKINQKLLQESSQQNIHIAPHTLEVASMVAIMSRLNEPKSNSIDLLKKMKAYNGEEVEGLRKQEIAEMKEDEEREGMEGLSPRYISNSLSKAITRSKEILKKRIAENDVEDLYAIKAEELATLKVPLDPLMVLNGLMTDIKEDPKIPKDQAQKYETIIELAKQEYNNLITTDVHKAFVYGFEQEAQDMFQNYIDHAIAFCQKEKIRDAITGKHIDPDENLMRAIERHIHVAEAGKSEFRTEILNRMAAFSHKNKQFTYETHKSLKEAIEKEIFERRKDTIHITTNTINPDPEQLEELNRVIKRMVQDLGYDPISANRALKYVARINQG